MKKVGVRALAQETGFSTATISRVLNGSKSVSADTKARVEDAMRRLNYIPNSAARALATRRTKMIGAVIPTIENSIFARFISSLEKTLAEADYSLVIAINAGSAEREIERAIELMNIGVEALVVSGGVHSDRLRAYATSNGTPIVCTSIFAPDHDLPTIGYDNFSLGAEAMSYLQNFGHRRIAVLHGETAENDRTVMRLDGIRSSALPETELMFFESNLSVHGGAESGKSVLALNPHPSALLCLSDVLALGALFEVSRYDLQVPKDLSIIGFDNLEWAETSSPALTTIDLPVVEMGRAAATAIIDHLKVGKPIEHVNLPAQIIERETVAQINCQ